LIRAVHSKQNHLQSLAPIGHPPTPNRGVSL
jgi:hypothetical protein